MWYENEWQIDRLHEDEEYCGICGERYNAYDRNEVSYFLGERVHADCKDEYIKDYVYGNVTTTDLLDYIDDYCNDYDEDEVLRLMSEYFSKTELQAMLIGALKARFDRRKPQGQEWFDLVDEYDAETVCEWVEERDKKEKKVC